MEYYAKLRNLRDKLETIELQLARLAEENGKSFENVIDDFNSIYHEYTSAYHEPNKLMIEITN